MKPKQISNPFSTGGGGNNFENRVAATFVTLMLTGGTAPCVPPWPIHEVMLQARKEGYHLDDVVVKVRDVSGIQERSLLIQVKHQLAITEKNRTASEVFAAAWADFSGNTHFTKEVDALALVTGPLTQTDHAAVLVCNHARETGDHTEFFRNLYTANVFSNASRTKYKAIEKHLNTAAGRVLSEPEVFDFLRHFYVLGFDVAERESMALALINSHIAQSKPEEVKAIWCQILEDVAIRSQHGCSIRKDHLPRELSRLFTGSNQSNRQTRFVTPQGKNADISVEKQIVFAKLSLLGGWNDAFQADREVLEKYLGTQYRQDSINLEAGGHILLNEGVWEAINRQDNLELYGHWLTDVDIEDFVKLATQVLSEHDPALDLPKEDRFAAVLHGKHLKYSDVLRCSLAEGLAILGASTHLFSKCTTGLVIKLVDRTVREILKPKDWVTWASVDTVLPELAEASPSEFLTAIEEALRLQSCPFDELFTQEGPGVTGRSYMTGILWGLERLAWEEDFIVRVCCVLAELAERDPGGQWANRPENSLADIMLPWLPQTLASFEKRKIVIENLKKVAPQPVFKLCLQLLPNQRQMLSGNQQPKWRAIGREISQDHLERVSHQEFWEQSKYYSARCVELGKGKLQRLIDLIRVFNKLGPEAGNELLLLLSPEALAEFDDEQRFQIWDSLSKLLVRHRKFEGADWALPEAILLQIEDAASKLEPTNTAARYRNLFTDDFHDLLEEKGDFDSQYAGLDERRQEGVRALLQEADMQAVLNYSKEVDSAYTVGSALAAVLELNDEQHILPGLLSRTPQEHWRLIRGYIWRRYHLHGWCWVDNFDRGNWSRDQMILFLLCLPFVPGAWERAAAWLNKDEKGYWKQVEARPWGEPVDYTPATEKLVQYGRPLAGVGCIAHMLYKQKDSIDVRLCGLALEKAISSDEPRNTISNYYLARVIKFFQQNPESNIKDILTIEWAYFDLIESESESQPTQLYRALAEDPQFFLSMVQLIYRSEHESEPPKRTSSNKGSARNAWNLLRTWRLVPGTKDDKFSPEAFRSWYSQVRKLARESGHLAVALSHIGEVLTKGPAGDDLWIHPTLAEVLNVSDNQDMRNGYRMRIKNDRGVHCVDPTGAPESQLSENFREKAEAVENAGYSKFATSLKEISQSYQREAEQIRANRIP